MYSFKTDLFGSKRRFALRPDVCTFAKVLDVVSCKHDVARAKIRLAVADTNAAITDDTTLQLALATLPPSGCLRLTVTLVEPGVNVSPPSTSTSAIGTTPNNSNNNSNSNQ